MGEEFYKDISDCKELLRLDNSLNNFFKKCALVNQFLEKKNLFLRVYERKDKFRYQIKKGIRGHKK